MFTTFMVALTLTTVANVLIVMAISPLVTAPFARIFLHHRLPQMTWLAIAVAGLGLVWMFLHEENATFSLIGVPWCLGRSSQMNWPGLVVNVEQKVST